MTLLLQTDRLTKRYGSRTALDDVSLTIPAGRVAGLVGPNGAGKSTLLNLATGMIAPTSGTITVLGSRPAADAAQLARIGFVAQDTPAYAGLTVGDHLRLGAHLNPKWDEALAQRRIHQVGLDPAQKAGRLSGGQRAQLALTVAAAKRPELLVFDEPVAALDPLARRAFLQSLMEFVAELGVSVILSSHLLGDLERVCDHLIVLTAARVQLAGAVEDLLTAHYRVVGARGAFDSLPAGVEVIQAEHTARQSTLVVHDPAGAVPRLVAGAEHLDLEHLDLEQLDLEDMVLAYLTRAADASVRGYPAQPLEVQR
jgi:ABC-2 type transport system ATP-binding protein